jgi:hypothetical protein
MPRPKSGTHPRTAVEPQLRARGIRVTWDATRRLRPSSLLLLAFSVLALPAAWAAIADTCSEAAWLVPVLASTGFATASLLTFGRRRGHAVLGVLGALIGGGLWLIVAFLVAFVVWIPFVPDRCTYDFGI